jgi:hypothetical protein
LALARLPRKRRTREHVIADLSINHVERLVLRRGWTVQRTAPDYGVDLRMETYNELGEPQSGQVLLQVKATDSLRLRRQDRAICIRLDWRDVLTWIEEPMPFVLVLYDARADRAYWLHIKDYFAPLRQRLRSGGTTTVYIPKTNRLNEAAIRKFAGFRDAILARIRRVIFHEE